MLTERVLEDGFSFLLLVAVLAFLWFHGRHGRRSGRDQSVQRQPAKQEKKAA